MKNTFFITSLILILFCTNLKAQNFYSQDFGAGTVTPAGWSSSTPWSVGTSNPSASPMSGGSNLTASLCGTVGTPSRIMVSNISTVGKSNIFLSYGVLATTLFLPAVTVEWSNNGTTWNSLTMSSPSTLSWSVVQSTSTLPAGAEGQSNLRIRWSFTIPPGGLYLLGAAVPCGLGLATYHIDDITLGQNSILPVHFSDVRAYKTNNGINIEWSNLTESDIVNYQVERSQDGQLFTSITQVNPMKTNGEKSDYSYLDAAPGNGINFYRVRSLETDGKKLYSSILRVDATKSNAGISLYPNPVKNGQLSLQTFDLQKGLYALTIYSVTGQQVYNKLLLLSGVNNTEAIQLPSTLKAGLYSLQLNNGELRLSKSFIIQ